ncbi:MAG: hypothetical protein A2086_01215 [Spirochaetes bacterium GWD1_27_9]|nr:MAG: hypothetical protein A2Z98_00935 [Spirochaetes bacterium GWB1_27_13]OHD42169.1 MAG: hypothetical protein A2086_01215 [Spirochaetes bacterium GWD1_27_9]
MGKIECFLLKIIVIFILIQTNYLFSLNIMPDNTGDSNKITKQNKNQPNLLEQEKEKKKQKIEKLKKDKQKYLLDIKNLNTEISKIIKQVNILNENLIKTLKTEEIKKNQQKKSDLLVKKYQITQKIADINKIIAEIDKELKQKDDNYVVADGTINWTKTFDIKKFEKTRAGTWSLTVVAKDDMNNTSPEEAINIKIDPNSDIPTLNVINPKVNGRIPSNLMIVGTAFDDDAIDKIIMFVDNEKEKRDCIGKDFWHYELDTSKMKDGIHTLKFKVYDINGVSSKEQIVPFNLDRKTPVITINSIGSGAIVSKNINIYGKAYDDNGIKSMEYSTDDRYSFYPILGVKQLAPNNTKIDYNVFIDSNILVDGIQTIWIKATDYTGSVGYFPLTITVDHKSPTIEFQYPKDKDKIGDRFMIYGVAKDNVDIKNITISIDGAGSYKKQHPVNILPGNPFWSFNCQTDLPKLIDLSKYKDGMYKITATVEDVAGNKKSSTISVFLDKELEKPTLTLNSLSKNDAFSSILPLYGTVNDDDEVKEVRVAIYKVDKNEEVLSKIVPSPYSFSTNIDISNLSEGKYRVELIPSDYFVGGNPVIKEFWIDRSYPKFDTNFINKNWAGKTFSGKIDLALKAIKYGLLKNVKYSIINETTNFELVKQKDLKFSEDKTAGIYNIDNIKEDFANKNIPQGLFTVKLSVTDISNKTSYLNVPIIIDSKEPSITELKIDEKLGMTKDEEITIDDNLLLKNVEIEITNLPKTTLKMGDEKEFVLKTKSTDKKESLSYKVIILARDLAGNEKKYTFDIRFKETKATEHKLKIRVSKKDNSLYAKDPITYLTNADKISIDNTNSFYFFAPQTIKEISYQFEGKQKSQIEAINKENGIYSFEIKNDDRKNLKIGDNLLKIFVKEDSTTDKGESERKSIVLQNDMLEPYGKILWPPSCLSFNQDITIFGNANDDSAKFSVSYSIDNSDDKGFSDLTLENQSSINNTIIFPIEPINRDNTQLLKDYISKNDIDLIENGKIFKTNILINNLKEGQHTVYFKIKDDAQKETIIKSVFIVDKTNPEINIWSPKDNETLNGKITIRGDAKDNNNLSNIVFILNDGRILTNGRTIWDGFYDLYNINGVNMDSKEPLPISIDVVAYDSSGNKKVATKKLTFDTKTDRPKVYINSPAIPDQRFSDIVELGGVALDDDGVDYVEYRLDKGINDKKDNGIETDDGWKIVDLQKGKSDWNVKIDKGVLTSGIHLLEVRGYDIYGIKSDVKSITFHIDMENPVVKLFSPDNGSYLQGEKLISGKSEDPNEIESVEISTSNGWLFVPAEGKESWKYYMNSNSLPDGTLKFLIKAKDKAGSESFSFAIYNIDNTKPEIEILMPKDTDMINNHYKIIGKAKDNIGIDKVMVKIESEGNYFLHDIDEEGFVTVQGKEAWELELDTTNWITGKTYHLVAKVYDLAGNVAEKTLDFIVNPLSDMPTVELDQPQPNQHLTGEVIEFFGTAKDDDGIEAVFLKIDDMEEVKAEGKEIWRYTIPTAMLQSGVHKVVVVSQEKSTDGKPGKFSGPITRLFYLDDSGPVITILSHTNGAPMEHRPWLSGNAYYYEKDLELKVKKEVQLRKYNQLRIKYRRTPEKIPKPEDISVTKYEVMPLVQKYLAENAVKAIYLTLDNGNTYSQTVGATSNWLVRVQTQYLSDGPHTLQLKAVTLNNKVSMKYFKIFIDRNLPKVIIDKPIEDSRLNDKLIVRGSTEDNGKVTQVKILLKRFDKSLGKMPKFVEGIYLWTQMLGGPWVSGGFGLSFFDDIVRLEGLFGWIPTTQNMTDIGVNINDKTLFTKFWGWENDKYDPRFYGFVTGGKILARVIDLPFEFFFGEDARNFSWSLEIGAGFYWMSGFGGGTGELNSYDAQKKGKVLAGFMYQFDFFKIERYGGFRKFAIYFEHSFYFIAAEVKSTLLPQIGFGVRNALF